MGFFAGKWKFSGRKKKGQPRGPKKLEKCAQFYQDTFLDKITQKFPIFWKCLLYPYKLLRFLYWTPL